jgi:hypothetical protein
LSVADDAGVSHEGLDLVIRQLGNTADLKIEKCPAECRTAFEDRDPRQPSLKCLEADLFEQRTVAVKRLAPLLIVVAAVLRIGG